MRGRAAVFLLFLLTAPPRTVRAEVRWAAWPPGFYDSAELLLATGEPSPVRVRVRGPGLDLEVEVGPGAPVRVPLPPAGRLREGGLHAASSWRLASEGRFTAVFQTPATEGVPDTTLWTSHDAAWLPEESSLGDAYRALSWPPDGRCYGPSGAEPCSDSWLAAVATRDGTRLRVVGAPCMADGEAGVLEAGDVWVLRCVVAGEDVTGTRVSAGAPFLLLSGNTAARPPGDGTSADNLVTAPMPESAWGTVYDLVPFPRDPFFASEGDAIRVVGTEGTAVTVDDGVLPPGTWPLPAGGVLDVDGASWGGRPLRISSSAPVAVAQLMKSRNHRGTGDPTLLSVPPESAGVRDVVWAVPDGYGEGYQVAVTAPLGTQVRLDGRLLDLDGLPLPGGTHGAVLVPLPAPARGALEPHRLTADRSFTAWMAGQGIYKSYAHPAGWARPLWILRGAAPDALEVVAREAVSPWPDPDALSPTAPALLYYRVEGAPDLFLALGPDRELSLRF